MATKSQLKQYFETGKIPTQAQFAELIDFIQPLISDDVTDRPNQTLRFGEDGTKPIVNGLRIVHYRDNDDSIFNFWLFTNASNDGNEAGSAVPVFAILRIINIAPGIPSGNDKLRYFIPEAEHITAWVQQGVDCDTAPDVDIFNALQTWPFKDWPEGGGSEFPRVAYIDSQSAWDTWYNNFKTAHPESGNSGGSGSPILNQRLIDGYTFIIETSEEINFRTTETLEFLNCTIINNDVTEDTISMNFSGCIFRNCYLESGYRITGGGFNSCLLRIDGNINNATISDCNLHGDGTVYACIIRKSDVKMVTLIAGAVEYSNIQQCIIDNAIQVDGCRLHNCTIYGARFASNFIEMIGCNISNENAFKNSTNEIKGFIFGCDFSILANIPGVMKGAQCCKFRSTLLSSGVIMADIFGNKNAATNGMNTGV